MLVVTVALPLVLDAVGDSWYFTSLALWGIPILYLWPVFNSITADGTGRGGRALWWTAGTIVALGVVLDFVLGYLTLRFPGCSEPAGTGPYVWVCPPWVARSRLRSCCSTPWALWPSCWCTRVPTSAG